MEDSNEGLISHPPRRRFDEDFLAERIRTMTEGTSSGAPEDFQSNPDLFDEEELMERVIKESLEQKKKEDEMRTMAGCFNADYVGAAGDSANAGELNTWMNTPLATRVSSALALTNSEIVAAENAQNASLPPGFSLDEKEKFKMPDHLPFDEQLRLLKTYSSRMKESNDRDSNREGGRSLSRTSGGATHSNDTGLGEARHFENANGNGNEEDFDEMMKKALALSMDPNEQHNQEVQSLLKAVQQSQPGAERTNSTEQSTPMGATGSTLANGNMDYFQFPSLSVDRRIAHDAEIARALEISRQEHAKNQIKRHLDEEKEMNKLKSFKGQPRPIVVDGNNVAYNHGNHQHFSVKALVLVYDYFQNLGHTDVTIFCTPGHNILTEEEKELLRHLEDAGLLKKITKRKYGGEVIGYYDDLYILKTAKENGGIIVTNDKFRDVMNTHPEFSDTIKYSVLPYQFVQNHFIPAEDPLGRNGPKLLEYLKF